MHILALLNSRPNFEPIKNAVNNNITGAVSAWLGGRNVRHVARGHMGTTTLGHGHMASCYVASCHLDKTVKYDILALFELNINNITNACFIV